MSSPASTEASIGAALPPVDLDDLDDIVAPSGPGLFPQPSYKIPCVACRKRQRKGREPCHADGLREATVNHLKGWLRRAERRITAQSKQLLEGLFTFWSQGGEIWVGQSRLAREANRHARTISRWMRRAEAEGLIGLYPRTGDTYLVVIYSHRLHELAQGQQEENQKARRDDAVARAQLPLPIKSQRELEPHPFITKVPDGWTREQLGRIVTQSLSLVLGRAPEVGECYRDHGYVLSAWRARGMPQLEAWLTEVRLVTNACKACRGTGGYDLRYEMRGIDANGVRLGRDDTRTPRRVFLVDKWERRLDVGRKHVHGACLCQDARREPPAAASLLTHARQVLEAFSLRLPPSLAQQLEAELVAEDWSSQDDDAFQIRVVDRAEELLRVVEAAGPATGPPPVEA